MWRVREDNSNFHLRKISLVIILWANTVFGAVGSQQCPKDVSYILQENNTVVWISKSINKEIVTSFPPCTDDNDHLVARVCTSNSSWLLDDYETCTKTTQRRRCPLGFVETSDTCRFITAPRPWSNICSFEALTQTSAKTTLENEFIWVPYKRLTKYGPYELISWGKDKGKPFDKTLNASLADPDFFNKNCLIVNASTDEYFPEFCYAEHTHVCEFGKKEANSRCPEDCKSADIVSGKCYCKQEGLCKTQLSKIETIFDLTILTDLAHNDLCYVDSDLPPRLDQPQGLGRNIWFYTDSPLQCSLCTSISYKAFANEEVEMVLTFDDKLLGLFLTIYSPESLFSKANENTIYCYTDASRYDLKKRLKIDAVVQYRQVSRPYNVYEVNLEKYIGTYWCEAYKDINEENMVVSNRVLAYKEKTGHEYSLRLTIRSICVLFPCHTNTAFNYAQVFSVTNLTDLKSQIRVMDIFNFDFESIDLLLHITTERKNALTEEYFNLKDQIMNMSGIELSYFRSSEFCLPNYSRNLTWPLTQIGQGAVAEELCLQENGLPVVRFCRGNFLNGAEWSDIVGDCHKDVEVPDSTKYIQSTLNQPISNETVLNVTDVIKSDPNLPVLSLYLVSKFLDNIYYQLKSTEFNVVQSTAEITDNLMNINKLTLVNAQELLNVTDDLLDLIDNILIESTNQLDVFLLQTDNLIIHVTNPFVSGISGLVLYQNEGEQPTIENLERNSTFENIGPNALLAMMVPEEIITHNNTTTLTIITTIFFKDTFFESNYSKKPSGPILSITIPEFGCYLPSTIPVLFSVSNYTDTPECGFWDYGKKSVRRKGNWSTVGSNYFGQLENESLYHICTFSHLTHFSLLRIMITDDLSETDDDIMDVIFYIGDALTILGITGIFLTAIMFERWRRKQGTVILLNLSVAILLEVFLMQITDTKVPFAPQGCGILGIFLHYIIISKFCWMLVYSFLQYMRFVKVLTVLPENIVIKSLFFGWGFALIPVGIVNIITRTAYTKKKYNFCYPTGLYLYVGTLLPVCIIVCINTYVFFTVMREVTSKSVESHGSKENIYKLQLQLAILLFFVLGVPWLFFVLANLIPISWIRISLAYLFCVTSNFQGFILFLFYVVFNSETRIAWSGYFNKKRPKSFSISTKISSRS